MVSFNTSYPGAISGDMLARIWAGPDLASQRLRFAESMGEKIRGLGETIGGAVQRRQEIKREDYLREEARRYAEQQKKYWAARDAREREQALYEPVHGAAMAAGDILGPEGRLIGGPIGEEGPLMQNYRQSLDAIAPYLEKAQTPEEEAALSQAMGQVRQGYETQRPFDIVLPSETPTADLYDIRQSRGYLEGLLGQRTLEDEYQQELDKLALRPPERKPPLPQSYRDKVNGAIDLASRGKELIDMMRDPEIAQEIGRFDTGFAQIASMLPSFEELTDVDENGNYTFSPAKGWRASKQLSVKANLLVWQLLKAIQGSRPSDFDMKMYQTVLNIAENQADPQSALQTLVSVIVPSYQEADSLANNPELDIYYGGPELRNRFNQSTKGFKGLTEEIEKGAAAAPAATNSGTTLRVVEIATGKEAEITEKEAEQFEGDPGYRIERLEQ